MRPARILVGMAVVLSACAGLPAETDAPSSTPAPTTATSSIVTDTTVAPPAPGCEGDTGDYRADGPLGTIGEIDGDGQQISSITIEARGECERVEVSVSTSGGAPATELPRAEVEIIAGSGVLRIKFDPSIGATAITDSVLEGTLTHRAYVVRSLDGAIFVDIHLADAVAGRTFALANPARVVVELQAIDAPASDFPRVGGLVVVTGPSTRAVEYPIVVTGYSRTFEATVIGRVFSDAGTEAEVVTNAADYLEMWGEFQLTIDDGPGGDVTVFIGEDSPADGTPQGVEFEVSAG